MKAIHKLTGAFAGAIVLVAIALSFWAFRQIDASSAARKHSFLVIGAANGLLSDLKDAETGQRGFVLTGEAAFLEPYTAAKDGLGGRVADLRRMVQIPAAQARVEAMSPLIEAKMAELGRVIALRRRGDMAGAVAAVRGGEGKRTMDAIRGEMRGLLLVEEAALARNDADLRTDMRRLFAVLVAGSLFVLMIAAFVVRQIDREAERRIQDRAHIETQRSLEFQEAMNLRLQEANCALQVEEERLAVTINSIGDAVIATDAAGRVTLLNPLAQHLTGWPQAEAEGHHVDEVFRIVNQETRRPAAVPVMEALARGTKQALANHTVLISRDGRECAIADSCAPIRDRAERIVGAVLVFRDVTAEYAAAAELKRAVAALESAKSVAEKASLAKSEFLSSMSHELRSPLNAILGFAQIMETADPTPSVSQKEHIGQILKAGWHLLALINEVLDLAVVESGKLSVSLEPVAMDEVFTECRSMMEPQAAKRRIAMTFPVLASPCYVRADRTRVKQVIINLLSNAIKYNRDGGTVVVECRAVAGDRVHVGIKDAGAGLPPDKVAQLFQPFNRLGQEASAEEGTGIGLVMSKRLVEAMGGTVSVESEVGVGSVFSFELAADSAPVLSAAAGEPAPAAPGRAASVSRLRTLLYVEDNPANLALIVELIARRPELRLLTAMNGTLGIDLARANQPDVILMDINLPGISGVEALQILLDDPTTAHIPVLAISANAMPRDIKKGLESGFFRYLTKPIKVNEFTAALNTALEYAALRTGADA